MTEVLERRINEFKLELRAAADGAEGPGVLWGYAATFDELSRDLGGWFEEIDPETFGPIGVLDLNVHGRVICRTNHDSNLLLGTTDALTLRISIDETGLLYEVDLPDTSYGRDLAVLAKRGDIRFSSFAFLTAPDGREWRYDEQDRLISRVLKAFLRDVAPVADPAYYGTSTEMRTAVDLAAVRAQLTPDPPPPGPPGESETQFRNKWAGFNNTEGVKA